MPDDLVSTNMGERTYADTVARGFYGKNVGGLFGKYDNVRAHWEDAMTRVALRPFVRERVASRRVVLKLGKGAPLPADAPFAFERKELGAHVVYWIHDVTRA